MTYNVFGGTLNLAQSVDKSCCLGFYGASLLRELGLLVFHLGQS